MNILIAKTILQSWINENDVLLYENDAYENYFNLMKISRKENNQEIKECLKIIKDLDMISILENKS